MLMKEGGGTVWFQGAEVVKVDEIKYLGSTVESNGDCGRECRKRVQAGWRKVAEVMCDRRVPREMNGRLYITAVRPAKLYGLETVVLTRKQEMELEVEELRMLGFSLGVTRLDGIRNEYIRGTAHVGRFGEKLREVRLRWFRHRDRGYNRQRMLKLEVPGKRRRGRPKRKFIDVVWEDMQAIGVTEQDAKDTVKWKKMFCCGWE